MGVVQTEEAAAGPRYGRTKGLYPFSLQSGAGPMEIRASLSIYLKQIKFSFCSTLRTGRPAALDQAGSG